MQITIHKTCSIQLQWWIKPRHKTIERAKYSNFLKLKSGQLQASQGSRNCLVIIWMRRMGRKINKQKCRPQRQSVVSWLITILILFQELLGWASVLLALILQTLLPTVTSSFLKIKSYLQRKNRKNDLRWFCIIKKWQWYLNLIE